MMKIPACVLFTFLIALRAYHAIAQLEACVNGACPASEAGASTCSPASTSLCVCDITFEEVTNDCALRDCTGSTAADLANACGGDNTACNSDSTPKCQCAVNYVVSGLSCNPIACTGANVDTQCADSEDYCDTASGTCACKKNFVGANAATCTRATCSDTVACSELNSICTDPTSSGGTCVCDHLSTPDATSGACVRDTCTVATVAAACGTQAACELNPNALQCVCNVNFAPSHDSSATACIQKTCTGTSASSCDSNSECASSNCQCIAATHTASGSRCKRDCSSGSTVCDSNAACVSNICECNVNYQGGGGTSDCTQLTCTGDDATTCHPNSQCVNSRCQCANNFEPSGTTCVACPSGWAGDGTVCKKTCTADTDCGPTTAVCTSSSCECTTNYVGNGTSCTASICTANSDCGTSSNYTCTSGSCACASGFSFSTTARDCISSAGTTFCSFALMITAAFISIVTGKIF